MLNGIVHGDRSMFSYQEGKRLAEAVFFQSADFPVVAVRFPIVLGEDDYTKRLEFHIEHVSRGIEIGIPNPDACLSFIHSEEAAHFLAWLGDNQLKGPVNACSAGYISVGRIVRLVEKVVGKPAIVKSETAEEHMSPFAVPDSACMDTTKAVRAGYSFQRLEDWLTPLINTRASSSVFR
jgi:nucleoside-diphosphate-sugar epimerase